ncbi:hypothetical protein DEU56DRAFT_758971 [Suillus clintonianus]|uniref:uncharacterized protein n=1 Tax=Suillus clintonianus TaxID=1904413 RepID=UPI001B8755C0|nr:uncharacterized protein DEU56DRAFT_758971 [Suillus clintonianus]KAG2126224.1 hypothetical protein DEU56DRAFT_758971 [Suillus clintonianus]
MSGLAALHCSTFAQGFSNNERQAAARALLRHDVQIDGTHYQTKTFAGLHPSYIAFQPIQQHESERTLSQKELCEAALQDVFDAITMQDRLDGGISLLIRCAGSDAISPEKIALDLYITPRELHEAPQQIGGDVAVLVQAFAQEFAVPHLQHFTKRCAIERSSHRSIAPKSFLKNLQNSSPAVAGSKQPNSAAIREGAEWAAKVATKVNPLTPRSQIRQRRPADVFNANSDPGPIFRGQPLTELYRDVHKFEPPLISIGPNTDTALDQFKLGDDTLPKLRLLVSTVRSSRWESVFRSQKWDLTYEASFGLSRALLADLRGMPLNHEIVERKSSVLSVILKWLAIWSFYTMVSQSFYTSKNDSRRVRTQHPRIRPKVTMSKEARATLTAGRRAKSRQFKVALDEAWNQLDDATKTIASAHHKSIRRVQNDLYIGHGILRSRRTNRICGTRSAGKKVKTVRIGTRVETTLKQLVREHKDEYLALSKEEQEVLLKEYTDWTKTKTTGTRISTKLWRNELNSLRCRTGAETILYTTRGSTDLPLRGVTFTTEGVEHFMHSVMSIDNQDLVSKMEGFAIQGMKGAAKNHKDRVSDVRSAIREIINSGLRKITGEPHANMQWTHYFRNIVRRYQVTIVGWPDNIPFVNLSKVSSALPELERLFHLWDTRITFWKTLTDEEFAKICQEHNEKLKSGEIEDIHRRTRSDKGTKRKRLAATNSNDNTAQRKKYKSAETIEDTRTTARDNGGETTPQPSPHQPSNANTTPNLTFEPSVTTPNFTFEPSITTPNFTFKPSDAAPNSSTPHAAGSSLDANTHFTFPPYVPGSPLDGDNHPNGLTQLGAFDCDAALETLDRIYGPAPSSSTDVDNPVFDFTNINMFGSTF